MSTKANTEQGLFGTTVLIDIVTKEAIVGDIAFLFNDEGRSEIQFTNSSSGNKIIVAKNSPIIVELVKAIRDGGEPKTD